MDKRDISKLISVIENQRLSSKIKLSFILYTVDDSLRYSDIASMLNIPLGTVKSQISRARSVGSRQKPPKSDRNVKKDIDKIPINTKWPNLYKILNDLEVDSMASIEISSYSKAENARQLIGNYARQQGLTHVSKYNGSDGKLYFKLKRDFKS